jgi:hypothetical protein
MYALGSFSTQSSSSGSTPSDLRLTTEREAENGQGLFQTLAPLTRPKARVSKKTATYQKKRLGEYLQQLQEESALALIRPCSPENTIIARYIHIFGGQALERQPLSILGTWIESIPSRMGSNRMLDLAVEFMVNSFDVFYDDTDSKRKRARASKSRALKELQLTVLDGKNSPSYDVLLATKTHYAAEVGSHGKINMRKPQLNISGSFGHRLDVSDIDDDHFWNLIDNTYVDDVSSSLQIDVLLLKAQCRSMKQCSRVESQLTTVNTTYPRHIHHHSTPNSYHYRPRNVPRWQSCMYSYSVHV